MRPAVPSDVPRICAFGQQHVGRHYTPLIGPEAASRQVRTWWNPERIGAAVAAELVVVADGATELAGVGQRGYDGVDHVIYKLYLHPGHRGHGLGPQLVDALVGQLPADAERLCVEHFAANVRAGAFYEREGFQVERVQPSPSGESAMDVVWRVRRLPGT